MIKHISSLQNPAVKRLLQLQEKSRVRKKEKGFIIEGIREIELAIAGGYRLTEVYFNEQLMSEKEVGAFVSAPDVLLISLSTEVYQKVAYRAGTEGIIAFAEAQHNKLEDLLLPKNPLILVAEAPEKPGNIGALLRTADAAAVDAVIIANPRTDLYNPNIIRSSVGCVFTTQIATATTSEVISFLQSQDIHIHSAILQDAVAYDVIDYKTSSAIVVGTEATGLTEAWRSVGKNIKIPMRGKIDSMNVSVAAGILIFEARRQRG
ncbi:TrmH family RNA methyltransferase [Dokdonia sp. Hel_I_53]|uniref:TrmH family RNA methyltransferase n=1 Tax=Dokdonia sp. Hel_I_53 TaxID=1566287 RepID=UPI00119B801B|nr:TrmH family RNA methyltransferase [Dokdonia sp. Hel_I_53]TVZ51561.1 TrmH family RNA methyltransferase [Dokdonia sp. Hel_I_53]